MRGLPPFRAVAAAVAALAIAAASAPAQERREPPRPDLVLQADSLAAAGDSAGARRLLTRAVTEDPQDAAAWHARGMLAWRMSRAEDRVGYMKRVANDTLLAVADSSLKRALTLRPDDARWNVDLGRFYLTSNSAATRGRATDLFAHALAVARQQNDSGAIARASDEMGMTWWRKYVDRADRTIYNAVVKNVKDRSFTHDPRSIAYFVDNESIRAASQEWSGQVEYLKASDYFTDAVGYDPDDLRAFRHLEMLFADRQRWMEVEHAARLRLLAHPADPWAWLCEGMALHRVRDPVAAAAAFDSAVKYMTPEMKARYDRMTRVITPKDSAAHARLPDLDQADDARMYWLLADPLWATPDNEDRLEFLSRVVYAELRFSVEEFHIYGADTERGEVYVRYGPPPAVISFPPDTRSRREDPRTYILWWYTEDETFLFRILPTYGVVTLEPEDKKELERLRDTIPAVYTNVGDRNMVDSIPVQLVRFRAGDDSGDVFVAAALPVGRMIENVDLAKGAVDISILALTWRGTPVFTRHVHETVDFEHADPVEIRAWRTRLHAGSFLYRVEALQPDARRGARAASRIEVVGETGFGLSDLLVADRLTPRSDTPARWTDFLISPDLAVVRRGHPFALLWEMYGFAPLKGLDRYRVTVTVQRLHAGGVGEFFTRIVGGIGGAVGLSGSGSDRVSLTFPREVAAGPVSVDYVTLDVGNAPAGPYLITVDVTDLVANVTTRRQSLVTMVE
ncbi:MAG TPA: GWxTD domain-containing protein [Gemmatimonadaceae bacterium]|nr:GWxTD domain-containing protein [Gemmatimonadaceae bacterium]